MNTAVETGPRRLLRDLRIQGSRNHAISHPPGPPRSKTTGELIEEVEHERDATKRDLKRAQRTIGTLRKKLRATDCM